MTLGAEIVGIVRRERHGAFDIAKRLFMAPQEVETSGASVVGGGKVGVPLDRFGVACDGLLEVALAALCVAPVIVALCRAGTRQEIEVREKAEALSDGLGVVLVGACQAGVEMDRKVLGAGGIVRATAIIRLSSLF